MRLAVANLKTWQLELEFLDLAVRDGLIDVTTALAAGFALNAVETAAGLAAGIAGGLLLAFPTPVGRRRTLLSVGACACLAAAVVGVGRFALA